MTSVDGDFIGRSLRRVEDERLLRGTGEFVADVDVPGMLHATIVRSPFAHARLRAVDLDGARAMRGVVAAFSGRDVVDRLRPMPSHRPIPPALDPLRQAPLAVSTLRYVGEPVAVIVAESRHHGEDAADAVVLDVDELPIVSAFQDSATFPLFEDRSNVVNLLEKVGGLRLDEALAMADVVVEEEFRVQRHSGVPLETRGLVARPDVDGGVTLWGVAKMPHFTRAAVAEMLQLDEERVRVRPVDIGGGFGVRGELYPEDLLVPLAAVRVGRPVRWIEDRSEHLMATNHARESYWRVRAGATRDGELVFLHGEVTIDIGAYARPLVGVVAEQCALNLLGPYRVRSFGCRAECVLTNKMGIGTMRAPGRYEATFAREGILDALAAELGTSPFALRDRNLLSADDYPYDTGVESFGHNVVYDSGDPREAFRLAAAAINDAAGAGGARVEDGRLVGVGVVPFIESTGLGPFEHARVSVEEPGRVVVQLATTSMGQGHETTFAQIAADAVGVSFDDVVVVEGDPASVTAGFGTFASRSLVMGGNAIWLAGNELRTRLEKLDPGRVLSLAGVLEDAAAEGVALDVEERFDSASTTYSYGAHAAIVAIDQALGTIEIVRYVVVADVGRVVNPQIVVGQIQGGVVHGIGGALLEELAYSDEGQPLTASLMDYLLPTAHDAPAVEVTLIDRARAPGNPLGVKGAGEVGTIAVGATIGAAARDALRGSCVTIAELPLKPDRLVAWTD
jgi:aerobic carbon-monoxide dehydrogenase large subunit